MCVCIYIVHFVTPIFFRWWSEIKLYSQQANPNPEGSLKIFHGWQSSPTHTDKPNSLFPKMLHWPRTKTSPHIPLQLKLTFTSLSAANAATTVTSQLSLLAPQTRLKPTCELLTILSPPLETLIFLVVGVGLLLWCLQGRFHRFWIRYEWGLGFVRALRYLWKWVLRLLMIGS